MARILVIEDEEAIRELCRRVLVRAGHEVVDAANGEVGLRLYRQDPTDLIITDLFMPEKDGIETIRELRRDFPAVRILAISGGAKSAPSVTFLRVAAHLGAVETLAKPFSMEELLTAVTRALKQE